MPDAVASHPRLPPQRARGSRRAPGRAMISSERISKRVRQLGHEISEVYANIDTIQRRFRKMKPASLRVAALLDRPARRELPVHIDFTGFVIPDRFVIGYGLDYAGLYRELPGIYSLS